MKDEDIQKIAQCIYEMMINDIQNIKYELIAEIRGNENSIKSSMDSNLSNIRSDIRSIQGQMYNLRRV